MLKEDLEDETKNQITTSTIADFAMVKKLSVEIIKLGYYEFQVKLCLKPSCHLTIFSSTSNPYQELLSILW